MSPQRLGQHFLKDAGWRVKILSALGPAAGEVWVEIGAGHGEMTRELARTARRVVAIEVDPPLVNVLRRLSQEMPNLEVAAGDILEADLPQLVGDGRFRVYGSLPYYITSPILHRLFEWAGRIESIAIVIQLEVAVRLVARPGRREYGYLSVLTQFYAQPEIALRIPPGAFQPRPKVASALVRMKLPGERATLGIAASQEKPFLEFAQTCFAHKRKTLLNNLRTLTSTEDAQRAMAAAGIAPQARAEELTLQQFAALFREQQQPMHADKRT